MAKFSRTWWGQRFIQTLEQFTDAGRLSRGRSYARGKKVRSFAMQNGTVTAQVRGSVNPYFGVYEEPLYTTVIEFKPISAKQWEEAIALISSKAGLISRLLLNEIPDSIDKSLAKLGLNLLPRKDDFVCRCSCPDWDNPCKHVAGVYYLVAAELDRDPFLLFELRGLTRAQLRGELVKSPLGQVLAAELQEDRRSLGAVGSYYTRPGVVAADVGSLREFWQGTRRLPEGVEPLPQTPVSGILVKTQGDFPGFWGRDNSFLGAMETVYELVRTKNPTVL